LAGATPKIIHLLRHGQTEANVYWADHGPGADPGLWDTNLTQLGMQQAAAAANQAAALAPPPQLLVSSPLSRALHTAELAFGSTVVAGCPRRVCHWAAERIYHASDVGIEKSHLVEKWTSWDFSEVPDGAWWHTHQPDNLRSVSMQSDEEFEARMLKLVEWLRARPEQTIALVCHWGVLNWLTGGRSFENAEFGVITL